MSRHAFILILLPLVVFGCASPHRAEPDSPVEKTEEELPLSVLHIQSVRVYRVSNYLWDPAWITLSFKTTNYCDGAQLSLLGWFATTGKERSSAELHLRDGGKEKVTLYHLTLGSPFCHHLAASLSIIDPQDVIELDPTVYILLPERVAKLRELLRGSYRYTSPPPDF